MRRDLCSRRRNLRGKIGKKRQSMRQCRSHSHWSKELELALHAGQAGKARKRRRKQADLARHAYRGMARRLDQSVARERGTFCK